MTPSVRVSEAVSDLELESSFIVMLYLDSKNIIATMLKSMLPVVSCAAQGETVFPSVLPRQILVLTFQVFSSCC